MTFTMTTALREIIRADSLQPWEGHQLTVDGFKLEDGIWVRRTRFEPVRFEHVCQVPRRLERIRDGPQISARSV